MRPNRTLLKFTQFIIACLALFAASPAHAEDPLPSADRLKSSPVLRHLKPNPAAPAAPKTPAERTIAQMHIPEGFRVDLVVAEPQLFQPIAFAFDERGRIWVAEAHSYPSRRPEGQGLDRIVIFDDADGDGRFETQKVFIEKLNLVSGFEVGHGGVWVGAAPELLFIPDRNRDDVPDSPPQILLDGFGFQDTHECLNSFLWGPDGWLYGNQGVFNLAYIGKPGAVPSQRTELRAGVWRYHPIHHKFEVFAHGGSNPWGLDYDQRGQIFMTHCRSYYGRGLTTHVIQGAHYWNQSNANYAPFIIATPPKDFPAFRNYLLACARYDHGAGGAGKPGSDAIYGGHSHVGTLIYLGDNWPDEFRGNLFTHNLGGHQINQQINRRLGSGFDTVHAGKDQFFCTDPKYVAVDLQYGPDGAVYIIDWYDQQHCHNPNNERWDRANGRIYRMAFAKTYKPVKVNLATQSNAQLVDLLTHKNEWFSRAARRLLHERAAIGAGIDDESKSRIAGMATKHADPLQRLRGLWTAHAVGALAENVIREALNDKEEYLRAWAIQLTMEGHPGNVRLMERLIELAAKDPSPVVRLYLASAIQRMPDSAAWPTIEALATHADDKTDRNLPFLLWQSLAQRMPEQIDRAFAIAAKSQIPDLADYVYWYAGTMDGRALDRAVAVLSESDSATLRRRLAGLWLAMEPRANVPMPPSWKSIAQKLYDSDDIRIRQDAERLAAVFGDDSMFPRLRQTLADTTAGTDARKHAFDVLSRAQDRIALLVFLRLLDDPAFRTAAINQVARYDNPAGAELLLQRFESFSPADRSAALNALTSRPSFAIPLLEAVSSNRIKRDQLTAFHVRRLTALNNAEVDKRVTANWGRIQQSPAEKEARIQKLEKTFNEAPLWAYESRAGQQHFQKLCAVCHRIGDEGARIGPELTGAGKHGIRYFLETIIDPDAVIGADFQMSILRVKGGDVLTGLIVNESPSALTLRMTTGETVIPKTDILKRTTSEKSMMPEGLLEGLSDREQLELLKYLVTH